MYNDVNVTVLHWNDGCTNSFFSHDETAIQNFIDEKKRCSRDERLSYIVNIITKSEYDRTMGFNTNI